MKLYGFPRSPNTWKVRAVAAHIGLPLELALVDLSKGQQRTPEYLVLNPTGRTPTLVDGDLVLWESTAIMHYLASQKPNSLWPSNPRIRADIMRWESWQLQHWGKEACEPLVFQRLVKKVLNVGPPDAAVVDKATECFHREARVLDTHLSKQAYVTGSEPTLADLSIAASIAYSNEAAMPLEPYQNVRDWFARVSALPAWRQTAPEPLPVAA